MSAGLGGGHTEKGRRSTQAIVAALVTFCIGAGYRCGYDK